jgi:hypothetical protein
MRCGCGGAEARCRCRHRHPLAVRVAFDESLRRRPSSCRHNHDTSPFNCPRLNVAGTLGLCGRALRRRRLLRRAGAFYGTPAPYLQRHHRAAVAAMSTETVAAKLNVWYRTDL